MDILAPDYPVIGGLSLALVIGIMVAMVASIAGLYGAGVSHHIVSSILTIMPTSWVRAMDASIEAYLFVFALCWVMFLFAYIGVSGSVRSLLLASHQFLLLLVMWDESAFILIID